MSCLGFYSDENDDVLDLIDDLEDDQDNYCFKCASNYADEYEKELLDRFKHQDDYTCEDYDCKNNECDACKKQMEIIDMQIPSVYQSFKELIDLEKLSRNDPGLIIGVLIHYARDIEKDEFPIKLPSNYPTAYRQLAIKTLDDCEILTIDELSNSYKEPKKRLDAILQERALFY